MPFFLLNQTRQALKGVPTNIDFFVNTLCYFGLAFNVTRVTLEKRRLAPIMHLNHLLIQILFVWIHARKMRVEVPIFFDRIDLSEVILKSFGQIGIPLKP